MTDTEALPPCPPAWQPPADYNPAPTSARVVLGTEEEWFLEGHALSVAELLDALDGYTATFWTTETHVLRLHRGDEVFDFSDPLVRITLAEGDRFEGVPR